MTELLPGTKVNARGLGWEIVSTELLGGQTLYRLRGIEGAVLGRELDVLVPFENVEPVITDIQPEKATVLRNWLVYHQAFLLEQALGSSALLAVQPGRLRIEDYQLVPVLRALSMSRARMLLCDDVGLGKTIQAGLVITELVARRLAHRILVVSPAGPLLEQWKMEMTERFGLRLDVIDRAKLEQVRRENELGANPFDHIPLGLVSVDFLKQEKILDQLDRSSYDIIVLDEAHHATDIGSKDKDDSQRRKLAEVIARKSDALLLLTATPHDGYDRSFASLLELLDPSLVDGRGAVRQGRYRNYVVRRLKRHIKDPKTGELRFKIRQVTPIEVKPSSETHPHFMEMHKSLLDLLAPELRRAFQNRRYSDVLAFIALLKRSVSTVESFLQTLRVVADRFESVLREGTETQEARKQRQKTLRDYRKRLQRYGTMDVEQEEELAQLEVEEIAQELADIQREVARGDYRLKRTRTIADALRESVRTGEQARGEDPKIQQVQDEIRKIRREHPRANILIFTEYVDSQKALVAALRADESFGKVLTLSGADNDTDRGSVTREFRTHDHRILVSTDAASEGLNLHQRCHHLIHLELPFNPNRLEQRNGRIDRYGQTETPYVRYLYIQGTFEEKILLRLIAKYERQRSNLTFVPNTLGLTASSEAVDERLLKSLMDSDTSLFKDESNRFDFFNPDSAPPDDEATKELLEEIDRSLKGFERAAKSNTWLAETGMNADLSLAAEAEAARDKGDRAGSVDLVKFVLNAIQMDNGTVKDGDIIEIILPPAWAHGLDYLPGYEPSTRTIRLSRDMDVTEDSEKRPVGYLGRAHPLVRRALDRVRNISFGTGSEQGQDRRASAVSGDVQEPEMLYTFLGRVTSRAGREYEQVVAVLITKNGEVTRYLSADEWTRLTDPTKAIRTTDVWKNYFSDWGLEAGETARERALEAFLEPAEDFIQARRRELQAEERQHKEWLKEIADDITSDADAPAPQGDLFTGMTVSTQAWRSISDPEERLVGFKNDKSNGSSRCARAETVLQVYQRRMSDLRARLDLNPAEVIPLGLLMIVPEKEVRRGS